MAHGSGSCGGPVHSARRWWLDQALTEVGQRRRGTINRGSGRRWHWLTPERCLAVGNLTSGHRAGH
jgi:hypothetical protein